MSVCIYFTQSVYKLEGTNIKFNLSQNVLLFGYWGNLFRFWKYIKENYGEQFNKAGNLITKCTLFWPFFKILTSSTHQICIFPNLLVNTGKNKEEIYQTKDCLENSLGKGFKIVGLYCQFFEWQQNNYFTIQFNLKPPNFEA